MNALSLSLPALAALRDWAVDPAGLVLMAGDASTRRYFRARDARGRSLVVMDCGEPLPGIVDGRDGFPFTRWLAAYSAMGIRVPELLGIAREAGLVLLEDLGDELLQYRLESSGPAACEGFYLRAVHWGRILADCPAELTSGPGEDPLVPSRLALEMDLFLAHAGGVTVAEAGLPPLRAAARALDAVAPGSAIAAARRLLHDLCEDVHAAGAPATCHRDYHARNLIVTGSPEREDVAVIDFQDTRRGPRAYDLASLAWDPYVTLPSVLVDRLVQAWRPSEVRAADWDDEVRLAAGQRLIKAAGSYAWLSGACGKAQYAQWLPVALRRAHERLERWPRRDELWNALQASGIPA